MQNNSRLEDGQPCNHRACRNHVTHICEGCGRTAARGQPHPNAYVECVIEHQKGWKRVGRLNHLRTHWQLSSYQAGKVQVVWPLAEVVSFAPIAGLEFIPLSINEAKDLLCQN